MNRGISCRLHMSELLFLDTEWANDSHQLVSLALVNADRSRLRCRLMRTRPPRSRRQSSGALSCASALALPCGGTGSGREPESSGPSHTTVRAVPHTAVHK